ncbi:hypothetical protein [Microbacterium sp. Marseille-Q6965]|uniref:hypothetical protein n=1 Tax=Microbacterium sp. Marseille-Q6965 TaxID=2965072 RepID=UPI0021B7AF2F|nr:hypothetical protein [Microbacterium sp. Marseille-Q6965]
MTTSTTTRPLSRGDRIALGIIATGAAAVAIIALAAIVIAAVDAVGRTVTVTNLSFVDAPLAPPTGAASARYESAAVTLAAAPASIRSMLFLEGALPALATIGTCAIAVWLGLGLIRSRPFTRGADAALFAVASIVMAGGIGGQVAGAVGRAETTALLERTNPAMEGIFSTFLLNLDLAPVGWGFTLALVGGVVGVGRRLQRDTEGLV